MKHPLFTVQHEAMLVIVWENNFKKWHDLRDYVLKHGSEKKQPNKGGLYTTVDDGQKDFGGWSDVGLEKYKKYRKTIRQSTKSQERLQKEKEFLQWLRTKHKKECTTDDLQKKLDKKRAKAAANSEPEPEFLPPKRAKIVSTIDDSDDENEHEGA